MSVAEIRRMSWNKLNVLQLMFNQANAFRPYDPAYAAAAPTDPAYRYSQADIAAIQQVAAANRVTIVLEIQNPTKAAPVATFGGIDRQRPRPAPAGGRLQHLPGRRRGRQCGRR